MRSNPVGGLTRSRIRAAAVVLGRRPKRRMLGLSTRRAYSLGAAAVILRWPDAVSPSPAITREYEADVYNLVGRPASLGRHRILPATGHTRARLALFRSVINELDVEPIADCGNFSPERGSNAHRRLQKKAHPATAVLHANYPMAIVRMRIADERGPILSGEPSAAGTDAAETGRHTYPTLTMLENEPGGWGSASADSLVPWSAAGPTASHCRQQRPSRESTTAPLHSAPRAASVAYFRAQTRSHSSIRTKALRKTKEQ